MANMQNTGVFKQINILRIIDYYIAASLSQDWKTLARKNRITLPASPCGAIMIQDIF